MEDPSKRTSTAQHAANERYSLEKLNRFMSEIRKQDDQAMVLSLATFLEDTLGRLLLAYFRSCKATKELVEGFNAPLGTFGSRIKAVYAFGMVTDDQFKDMEILRKVRNHFAHNWEGVSFERNDIQALIGQLSGYTVDHKPIEGGPREKLLGTLSTCCMELQVFLGRLVDGMTERAPDVSHRLALYPQQNAGIGAMSNNLRIKFSWPMLSFQGGASGLTVSSTWTPTAAMPSAFYRPLLVPYALRAPAPVNSFVGRLVGTFTNGTNRARSLKP